MQKQGQSEHTGVLTNYAHVQMHVHTHSQTRLGNGDGTFTDTSGHKGLWTLPPLCICIVFIFMISESHFVLSPKLDIWEKNV